MQHSNRPLAKVFFHFKTCGPTCQLMIALLLHHVLRTSYGSYWYLHDQVFVRTLTACSRPVLACSSCARTPREEEEETCWPSEGKTQWNINWNDKISKMDGFEYFESLMKHFLWFYSPTTYPWDEETSPKFFFHELLSGDEIRCHVRDKNCHVRDGQSKYPQFHQQIHASVIGFNP